MDSDSEEAGGLPPGSPWGSMDVHSDSRSDATSAATATPTTPEQMSGYQQTTLDKEFEQIAAYLARGKALKRKKEQRKPERVIRSRTDPGTRAVPRDTPPNEQALNLPTGLQKAESAVLVQVQTGQIRPSRFLHSRKVPGVLSANCRCKAREEISSQNTREVSRGQVLILSQESPFPDNVGSGISTV
jgi:hypothetical protein